MEPSILQKKAEIFLERDVYPLLKNFPQAEKFSLSQEIKQSCFRLIRAAVMANNLTVVKKRLEWLDEADAEKTLLLVLFGVARTQKYITEKKIHEELQNMFRPVFINGSFACQYGRGPIRAAFKVQHDMRVARMKWGDNAAIIKIDARKFFYSIDRALLKKILAKRFKKLKKKRPETYEDLLRFYRLLCKVIDSSPEGETGIPLGNVSSQDFANIYLNELDQFCVRFLGAKLYTRYMDDIVIVAPDKETAREWLAKIKVFLRERLHLDTNKKTKVFYMRQGVNAYGFKIKATHMMLRTESKRREKRRVKAMVRKMREGKLTRSAVVQAVNSWLGFARWACAYNLAKKIFAPYRFIKTEGAIPYGAISRNRQARRLLQQRRDLEAPYKAVA